MLDHALGRPDPRYRKYQVLTVVALWSAYICAQPDGPKPISKLSRFLGRRLTLWQTVVLTCVIEYVRRNLKKILPWLESPEPLADMYSRDYFRATWVTTALDAGFWTAMRIRSKWLRDLASVLFTGYYLICAEQADQVVRKVRGKLSLEHLRVSWNKSTTPYLAFFGRQLRPRHLRMRYKPRRFYIPRPKASRYTEMISAVLYFDGPVEALKTQDKIILDIPGGGFVAMDPRCHDDKLMTWAVKTGFPVVSLNYKKAPEHPYPYALNECFDAYYQIVSTRGTLVGLQGIERPKIIVSGDSAGGNLAVGMVLMMLQSRSGNLNYVDHIEDDQELPLPESLILVYPALDMNMTCWLTDEQSALIKDPTRRKVNEGVVRRKTEDWHTIINSPLPADDEIEKEGLRMTKMHEQTLDNTKNDIAGSKPFSSNDVLTETPIATNALTPQLSLSEPRALRTRLEMTSMISYVDDRILSPEMLRAMIILYLGENKRPDFQTEYLLSPLRAPEELLRHFPKVYMLTGERDPLSDDTVLFAGRLLEAHLHQFQSDKESGYIPANKEFRDSDYVHYELIPGVSHGFLQFALVYEKGYELIELCSRWMKQAFHEARLRQTSEEGVKAARAAKAEEADDYFNHAAIAGAERLSGESPGVDSSDHEDEPLEMSRTSMTLLTSRASRSSGKSQSRRSRGRPREQPRGYSGRSSPVEERSRQPLLTLTTMDPSRRMGQVQPSYYADDSRRPTTPGGSR